MRSVRAGPDTRNMRNRAFRSTLQWVAVAVGWALFGWSWVRVAEKTPASTVLWSIGAVVVIAIVVM